MLRAKFEMQWVTVPAAAAVDLFGLSLHVVAAYIVLPALYYQSILTGGVVIIGILYCSLG